MPRPKPVLLLILDGWGYRQDTASNTLALARLPNWHALLADYPHTLVETHGLHVGLPDGQMGNSEVGHMNIGAGRVVYQDLTRIDAAIADGSFFHNAALLQACAAVKSPGTTLHVFGLLSPGGVHSHEQQIFAMLELAREAGRRSASPCARFSTGATRRRRARATRSRNCRRNARSCRARSSPRSAAATTRWIATSAGIACSSPTMRSPMRTLRFMRTVRRRRSMQPMRAVRPTSSSSRP